MSNGERAPVTVTAAIEGAVDEAIAKRLIGCAGGQAGPIYGKRGKSRLETKIGDYNNAARFSPWFVLVDLDTGCAVALRNAWLPAPASLMCFRIAVYEAEAWLMADAEPLADYLEAPVSRVPRDPEILTDPKSGMIALARRSASEKIRGDMTPRAGDNRDIGPAYNKRLADYARDRWRPGVAARRSDSLRRAIAGLRALVANAGAE